jgi:putative membrane protein insertion efficiency factor
VSFSLTTKCLLFLLPIIRVVPARGLLILREKDELCRRIIIIIISDDDDERDVLTVTANTSAHVNVDVVVVAVNNRNRRKTRRGEEALKLECSRCVFNHHHHRMGGVFAGASSSSFTSLASSSGRNEDDESDEKKEEEEEEGNSSSSSSSSSSDSDKSSKEENKQQEKDILVQLSLSLIDFYRNELSPFMPKSCRFIPSCSNYAFEAYTKYGAAKGFILTAWRIARCNPFGGRGYDPPRWPPSFTRGGDGE